jgi:hypothetical protein
LNKKLKVKIFTLEIIIFLFFFKKKDVSTILKTKEDTVLNAWQHRKKIIDEYLQYNSFKRNTDKVFVWIDEHDECFVSKLEELDIKDEGYMDFVRALKVCLFIKNKMKSRIDFMEIWRELYTLH